MRVDFITTELRPGGAERCLTEIALACQSAGAAPRVISLASLPVSPQQTLVARLQAAGIETIGLGANNRKNPWQGYRVYRKLRRLLRCDPPQVVQTFLFYANVLGIHAAYRERIPRRVAGIRVADDNRVRLAVEKRALRSATDVACVSEAVANFTRHKLLPPDRHDQVVVTPNGVSITAVDRAEPVDWQAFGLRDPGPVMLFLGRLHPQKGLDWLLANVPPILREHPSLRIVFAGEGPMRTELADFQRRIGDSRLVVAGWQPDPVRLMKGANLLVLPSRFEGMPNVVLEAMAAQLPIVATRVEGVQELLGPDYLRQTVDFGDDTALQQRIRAVLDSPQQEADQLARNRQRIEQQFSLQAMTQRFLALYGLSSPPVA